MQHIIPIIIGIFIFGLVIFIHELGHFVAARRCGILVEEFALGMGPKIISWQPGETLYSLRLFPIGGFCRMEAEDEESSSERSFGRKSVPKRMITILAGSIMNLTLALIIFALSALTGGFVTSATVTTTIDLLTQGGPAEQAGLLSGDKITHINGVYVSSAEDAVIVITTSYEDFVNVEFLRDDIPHQLDVSVAYNNGRRIIGVIFDREIQRSLGAFQSPREGMERASFGESVAAGAREMVLLIRITFTSLGQVITGQASLDMLMGPIGIVGVIDDNFQAAITVAEEVPRGDVLLDLLRSNLLFAGFLSAAIGIFNLLPLPALDGGRFIFLALEGVRGKPIKPETEGTIHFTGFVLLMALAVYIAYRDVIRLMM
ncbi:MAG: site-2 protease family protein [Defluviitaleaceae bacterium]|nr:site-2 protease family protein [Defluviitaleaceae bacterium]